MPRLRKPPLAPSTGSGPAAGPHYRDEVLESDAVYDPPAEEDADAAGLARAAFGLIGHTGSWAARAPFRAGRRVVGIAIAPTSSVELVRDVTAQTTRTLATVVEATDLNRRLDGIGPVGALVKRAASLAGALLPIDVSAVASAAPPDAIEHGQDHDGSPPSLRERGDELLRRSRDVNDAFDAHPAYSRILSELTPDEARILQLMLIDGPQPTVDVRTGGPVGLINSHLIAPGLSMIGARAGCRYGDRVPSYLNNLFRLGLIWFSQETLRNHQRYQVLEAQPDVLAAIHSVAATKVIRRSVHLTPFGEDFCRFCFTDGRVDGLPEHSPPRRLEKAPQPPSEKLES